MIRVEFTYNNNIYQVEYNLERFIELDMDGLSVRYNPIANTVVIRIYNGKWEEVDWTDDIIQAARIAIYEQLAHAITTSDKPFVSSR